MPSESAVNRMSYVAVLWVMLLQNELSLSSGGVAMLAHSLPYIPMVRTQLVCVHPVHSCGLLTILEDNAAIMHQLHERQEYLVSLCAAWQDAVSCIPCLYTMPASWDSLSEKGSEYDGKDAEFMDWAEKMTMVDVEQRDSVSEVRNEIDTYIGRKRH
jgi:hypothetical protein